MNKLPSDSDHLGSSLITTTRSESSSRELNPLTGSLLKDRPSRMCAPGPREAARTTGGGVGAENRAHEHSHAPW